MKKLTVQFLMLMGILIFCACGADNSPKGVADKASACIKSGDFEGYVDLIYFDTEKLNADQIKERKAMYVNLLNDKAKKSFEQKGGIDSYEIVSEEISEDGNSAKVGVKIKYGNGEEDENQMKLLKDASGNWKLDSGK